MKFKNIKTVLVLMVVTFFIIAGNAQKDRNRDKIREKVCAQKVSFITEKLELSEVEAQKFWPIYNDFQDEQRNLKASLNLNPKRDMTDKEAEEMMYAMLDGKSKEIELQKKFIAKAKTAIPTKKIALFFKVEREFKEKLISRVKDRRKEK